MPNRGSSVVFTESLLNLKPQYDFKYCSSLAWFFGLLDSVAWRSYQDLSASCDGGMMELEVRLEWAEGCYLLWGWLLTFWKHRHFLTIFTRHMNILYTVLQSNAGMLPGYLYWQLLVTFVTYTPIRFSYMTLKQLFQLYIVKEILKNKLKATLRVMSSFKFL